MRVLIGTNTYPPHLNGQAVFAGCLAEGMAAKGHQVSVLVPGVEYAEKHNRNGVRIIPTPIIDLRFIHNEFCIAAGYQKMVKAAFDDLQPEIVHLQDPAPLSQMMLKEARRRKIPVVCTHHTGPAIWAPYLSEKDPGTTKIAAPIIWSWIISFLNQADIVTVPSRASVRMLMQHGLKVPVRPISCGVQVAQFQQATNEEVQTIRKQYQFDPQKRQFLYVGRIDEEKRVDVLLKGFAASTSENIELILAGGGAAEDDMKRLAVDLGITHKVRFLGKVPRAKIPALYTACDAFIMPGDVESLSIATLEAMACGKPVIAANAMALPEMVQVGKNGLLFKPSDPVDLGAKIDQLAQLEYRWQAMGALSFERVQAHDLSRTILHYEKLYQRVKDQVVQKRHIPAWVRMPAMLLNPYMLAIFAQWAAVVLVLAVSLLTNSTPAVAAPPSEVELISPEMMQNLQEVLSLFQSVDLPSNQASGMFSAANGMQNLITLFGPN